MTNEPNDEIREAVARALCEGEGYNPDSLQGVRIRKPRWEYHLPRVDGIIAAHKQALATTGLVILPREASEGMLDVIPEEQMRWDIPSVMREYRREIWRAMVAKAEEEMG